MTAADFMDATQEGFCNVSPLNFRRLTPNLGARLSPDSIQQVSIISHSWL